MKSLFFKIANKYANLQYDNQLSINTILSVVCLALHNIYVKINVRFGQESNTSFLVCGHTKGFHPHTQTRKLKLQIE